MSHGSQKLFGWFGGGGLEGTSKGMHAMGFRPAKSSAVLAGVGEAGAGLALAVGLATPAAGAAAAATMAVAASVHAPGGFFAQEGGLEYPVLSVAAATFTLGGADLSTASGPRRRRRYTGPRRRTPRTLSSFLHIGGLP